MDWPAIAAVAAIIGAIAATIGAVNSWRIRRHQFAVAEPRITCVLDRFGSGPGWWMVTLAFENPDTIPWQIEALELVRPRGGGFDVKQKTVIGAKMIYAAMSDLERSFYVKGRLPIRPSMAQHSRMDERQARLAMLLYAPPRPKTTIVMRVYISSTDAVQRRRIIKIKRQVTELRTDEAPSNTSRVS